MITLIIFSSFFPMLALFAKAIFSLAKELKCVKNSLSPSVLQTYLLKSSHGVGEHP